LSLRTLSLKVKKQQAANKICGILRNKIEDTPNTSF